MKALTIHQPWAHLICGPDAKLPEGLPRKRVENRTWSTDYRGPLLIHAGKSTAAMTDLWWERLPGLPLGWIVGAVELLDCIAVRRSQSGRLYLAADDERRHPWLRLHCYLEGPVAWVLGRPLAFAEPIRYRGQQGLFDVTDAEVDRAYRRAVADARRSLSPAEADRRRCSG